MIRQEASEIVISGHLWKLSGAGRWTCEEYDGWDIVAMDRNGRRVFAAYDKETTYYGTLFRLESAVRVVIRHAR